MAISKNFVVKNGLEVAVDSLVVDTDTKRVGIGSTTPQYLLDVKGGIGATDLIITGFSTFANDLQVGTSGSVFYVSDTNNLVGVGTSVPAYTLDVRGPVSTGIKALYVYGDAEITGDLTIDDFTVNELNVSGISTFVGFSTFSDYVYIQDGLNVTGTGITATTLEISGLSTFTGIGTFQSDLYVAGDLYIQENITLDTNLSILGIATIGTLEVTNFALINDGLVVTGSGTTTTTLNVSGVSTFSGNIDANGDIDIDGHTELDDVNVSGVSTFTGIGTFQSDLYVGGDLFVDGNVSYAQATSTNLEVTGIATIGTTLDVNGDIDVDGHTELDNLNVTGFSTFAGLVDINSDIDVDGHTELDDLNVSGVATITSLDVQSNFDVYDSQATFHNDVLISGNLSIGGTLATVFVEDLRVSDKDLILGFTTDTSNNDVSNDNTANHGGIAIASTEGNPLVNFTLTGINTIPDTYKQIMWSKADSYGFGTTDAWLFNYGVGIGSTLVPNGVRLAVSEIQFTDDTINTPQVNVSGASTFVGFATFNDYVFVQDGLNVGGITTSNAYAINGTQVISSGRELQNIASLDATTTATIESAIANAPNTFTDLRVSGVSTFIGLSTFAGGSEFLGVGATTTTLTVSGVSTFTGTIDANGDLDVDGHTELDDVNVSGFLTATNAYFSGNVSIGGTLTYEDVTDIDSIGVITARSGINVLSGGINIVAGIASVGTGITMYPSTGIISATAFYGDGSYLTGNARNLTATIGIGTSGGVVGYGVSFLDLRGAGVSTAYYNGDVGIATIFFEGGGGGGSASIGIGSTPGDAFVGVVTAGNLWYNTDIGRLFIYYQDVDSAQWVDAAPFNIGIVTSLITSLTLAPQTAATPSLSFIGDTTTGLFSPGAGQQTFVSVGASVLNINPSGVVVTGIVTAQDFDALSDINYKENINTVNNALLKVEQLRGVKFDWKESGNPSYGVIAQELEQVLPELVHGNEPKTVNYNGIIGVLIEAIKELKAEVEELKNTK